MTRFDVVVIGGGSSGCAVAGRLARVEGLQVCLVEAGPDYGPREEGRWPPDLLDPRRIPLTHDWEYVIETPGGSAEPEPRAQVVGGCSAHNQCAAVWGRPADYDAWATVGPPGWSYRDLTPSIERVERTVGESGAPPRGRSGAVPTRPYADGELAAWQRWFLESALAAGFTRLPDVSVLEPDEGVAPFHANVEGAVRWNAAFAFLDPVRESPNLTIKDGTLAERLVLEGGRALELHCHEGDEPVSLRAERFVLCAGTFGSPLILLRSGVGPADHLEEVGIPVPLDLPGVGENLHDHPGATLAFEPGERAAQAREEEVASGRFYESQVILRARSGAASEGFDLHLVPYQTRSVAREWRYEVLAFAMAPRSRGSIRLRDKDWRSPPRIDPRFLSDRGGQDLAVLAHGLRLARRLAATGPLATVAREVEPGPAIQDDPKLSAYLRSTVGGYAHPVGTCRLGPAGDAGAVVDGWGRVHGLENVYVADASIIPRIPRANTNLTCMLLGLRIGDLLAADSGSR